MHDQRADERALENQPRARRGELSVARDIHQPRAAGRS
jgi:hypothetical protein